MRRVALLLALVVGFAACPSAMLYQLKLKPYELVGTDFPLPSGLRVFFQEDHDQPSVMVATTIGVGGSSDPVEINTPE